MPIDQDSRNNLVAFCVSIAAILALTLAAVIVCITVNAQTHLPEIIAAMGFVGSGITGLIAIAGGFRFGSSKLTPGATQKQQENMGEALGKIPDAVQEQ